MVACVYLRSLEPNKMLSSFSNNERHWSSRLKMWCQRSELTPPSASNVTSVILGKSRNDRKTCTKSIFLSLPRRNPVRGIWTDRLIRPRPASSADGLALRTSKRSDLQNRESKPSYIVPAAAVVRPDPHIATFRWPALPCAVLTKDQFGAFLYLSYARQKKKI